MKKRFLISILAVITLVLSFVVVSAQEEARAAWQVTNFDITANVQQAERNLSVAAVLSATNVGRGTGSSFTFRLNNKAVIKSVTIGGATAAFRTVPETYGNLHRVTVTVSNPVASGGSIVVTITYNLPVESNSGFAAISPIGSQFLAPSFWFPSPNTQFSVRGADSAPVRLAVNASNVISSGMEKSGAAGTTYEQALFSQPFFVQGEWDRIDGTGDGKNIIAFAPRGATPDEKRQAEALIALTAAARAYYGSLLGPAPDVPIRLVVVRRGSGFNDTGTILIEPGALRRAKIDSTTALLISEAVSRLWIGGQIPVRGEGGGLLRDALPRYLATQFIEKQFGRDAARAEMLRERLAYSTVAKKDAPLSRVTPLEGTYFGSVPNKGAMVWRLVESSLGRDAFLATLRELLQAGKGSGVGISLASLRSALVSRGGGERVKLLLDQQLDQVTDLDLMVGLPQQRGAEWVAALRNVGTTDVSTTVKAITATGEQLSVNVNVPARNFGEAVFKTSAKIVRAEVDPEKLYPQLDYANDSSPRTRDPQEAMVEAKRLFDAQDHVKAETTARELLNVAPLMQEARIILARALLAQNKLDEAERVFRAAIDDSLPTPSALAWGNTGLAEIHLRKGQPAEAAKRFNDAVRADGEYASAVAARAGRIKAETAANTLQIDGTVRTFISQLDQAILSGKKVELESRIVSGELTRFINGLIGTQPEVWQTRVLRTEQLDANLVAADVSLDTKELGRQRAGTAVFILARVAGNWKLLGIDLFEVN